MVHSAWVDDEKSYDTTKALHLKIWPFLKPLKSVYANDHALPIVHKTLHAECAPIDRPLPIVRKLYMLTTHIVEGIYNCLLYDTNGLEFVTSYYYTRTLINNQPINWSPFYFLLHGQNGSLY